ncbi:5185_t:CDS:2, partial [Ambispora gerdemannii]
GLEALMFSSSLNSMDVAQYKISFSSRESLVPIANEPCSRLFRIRHEKFDKFSTSLRRISSRNIQQGLFVAPGQESKVDVNNVYEFS